MDSTQSAADRQSSLIAATVLLGVVLCVGLGLLWMFSPVLKIYMPEMQRTTTLTAEVINQTQKHAGTEITYSFEYHSETYENRVTVTDSNVIKSAQDGKVEVYFDAKNPSNSGIEKTNTPRNIIIMLIAVFAPFVMIWLAAITKWFKLDQVFKQIMSLGRTG